MVIVLMGVSGSGKTTVGRLLARELGWSFYEGDDFHPLSNVAKMKRGVALTDDDRKIWLKGLHQVIERMIEKHQNGKDKLTSEPETAVADDVDLLDELGI